MTSNVFLVLKGTTLGAKPGTAPLSPSESRRDVSVHTATSEASARHATRQAWTTDESMNKQATALINSLAGGA